MWPFDQKILSYDQRSMTCFCAAKLFALDEGSACVHALHFLKGVVHCGDPDISQIFDTLQFTFEQEVERVNANSKKLNEEASATKFTFTDEVKKILARANRYAAKEKRKDVIPTDLLWGILEESPDIVEKELSKKQIGFQQVQSLLETLRQRSAT